eukprot:4499792-Heterocapsa_arctica.AAC.1
MPYADVFVSPQENDFLDGAGARATTPSTCRSTRRAISSSPSTCCAKRATTSGPGGNRGSPSRAT